ncbi:ClpP/crotonase [Auriculariales sp. MPI-PUGE-AT-0066]|nr:ClpP/crotonase [Auriculariales sp. MPI-PUGE-AT-0066]
MAGVEVDYGTNGIATITFNRPKALNALTIDDYNAFATALREIDKRPDVFVTIWQAHGDWFSSGTDVREAAARLNFAEGRDPSREVLPKSIWPTNTDTTEALYSHSKVLVAALQGPVMGITAAFVSHCDIIYCLPKTHLSVPFAALGLITEAGSSVAFVNRMGLSKANEALLFRRQLDATALLQCGFVNEIFPEQSPGSFHAAVRKRVETDLKGLHPPALLAIKKLIRTGLRDKNDPDLVNWRESQEQARRVATGIPARRFQATVEALAQAHKSKL